VAETKTKVVVPTENQKAILDLLKNGRSLKTVGTNGKAKLVLLLASGKPVPEQPKVLKSAFEACIKKGWINVDGYCTEEGKVAKRLKK